ncbi:hypothetical protein SNE40_008957 [Patella caerulea]|uniref:BPTI/Kunitz inhibitor domain-containing protein n=1 Tax=Patella caerulea TaxID=87958 RepID=A0AAN8JU14_PATCE
MIWLQILGVDVLSVLGQNNLHSHGTIIHSHTDTTFHTHPNMPPGTGSRPVPGRPHLHRHGTIFHSHRPGTIHNHHNLPEGSKPVPNEPLLEPPGSVKPMVAKGLDPHGHGSVTHSHTSQSSPHSHPDLSQVSGPVGHGSVTRLDTGHTSPHSHPDPSQASGLVLGTPDLRSHGPVTHPGATELGPNNHHVPPRASVGAASRHHGAVTHPLPTSVVDMGSIPAAGSPDVNSHGSVTHSHTSISSQSPKPSGPGTSDVRSSNPGGAQHGTDPNYHSHGSLTHSHSGTTLHHHPNLPSNSNRVPGSQGFHSHGNVRHSHSGSSVHSHHNLVEVSAVVSRIPDTQSTVQHTGSQPGLPRGLTPVRQVMNQRNTLNPSTSRSARIPPQTATSSSVPGANRPGERMTFNRDAPPPQANRFRGTSSPKRGASVNPSASDTNIFMHPSPFLSNIFNNPPTPNIARTPPQANILSSSIPVNGRRVQTRLAIRVRPSQAFRDPQRPSPQRRQRVPNYSLAGGANCNAQCLNGRAPRSCFCSRYLCLYQGCSANCTLFREGEFIRASCKPFVGGPYYYPKTTSNDLPRCAQALDPGSCSSRLYARYGYDPKQQGCVRFFYSGCDGNHNRFTTRNACNAACP